MANHLSDLVPRGLLLELQQRLTTDGFWQFVDADPIRVEIHPAQTATGLEIVLKKRTGIVC